MSDSGLRKFSTTRGYPGGVADKPAYQPGLLLMRGG
jgi:hypothetical protein